MRVILENLSSKSTLNPFKITKDKPITIPSHSYHIGLLAMETSLNWIYFTLHPSIKPWPLMIRMLRLAKTNPRKKCPIIRHESFSAVWKSTARLDDNWVKICDTGEEDDSYQPRVEHRPSTIWKSSCGIWSSFLMVWGTGVSFLTATLVFKPPGRC